MKKQDTEDIKKKDTEDVSAPPCLLQYYSQYPDYENNLSTHQQKNG